MTGRNSDALIRHFRTANSGALLLSVALQIQPMCFVVPVTQRREAWDLMRMCNRCTTYEFTGPERFAFLSQARDYAVAMLDFKIVMRRISEDKAYA